MVDLSAGAAAAAAARQNDDEEEVWRREKEGNVEVATGGVERCLNRTGIR